MNYYIFNIILLYYIFISIIITKSNFFNFKKFFLNFIYISTCSKYTYVFYG